MYVGWERCAVESLVVLMIASYAFPSHSKAVRLPSSVVKLQIENRRIGGGIRFPKCQTSPDTSRYWAQFHGVSLLPLERLRTAVSGLKDPQLKALHDTHPGREKDRIVFSTE